MAKTRKHQASKSRSGGGHLRVVCPQCGKRVNVPAQLAPTQQSYPCPSCRVPIGRALIEAAKAEAEGEAAAETATVNEAEPTAGGEAADAAESGGD